MIEFINLLCLKKSISGGAHQVIQTVLKMSIGLRIAQLTYLLFSKHILIWSGSSSLILRQILRQNLRLLISNFKTNT